MIIPIYYLDYNNIYSIRPFTQYYFFCNYIMQKIKIKKELLALLPTEMIFIIIGYTYQPQNKVLLEDIIDYHKSKLNIHKIYNKIYSLFFEFEPNADLNWLINDIFGYANDYNATMNGYIDKFYKILFRNFSLKTKTQVHQYIFVLENKAVNTQINILWGLLYPKERNEILTKVYELFTSIQP